MNTRMPSSTLTIVLPYPGAEAQTALWSDEDNNIDFRKEPDRAARCTLAFAALELQRYLARTLPPSVMFAFAAERPASGFWIELQVERPASKDARFSMIPDNGGVILRGVGRAGTLYAAYELLRLQGWRWYAPGVEGEIAPPPRQRLAMPNRQQDYQPSMDQVRGFEFEGLSKESSDLLLWMARNRLNLCGSAANTHALAGKLAMTSKVGGHIFEHLLDPNRVLASGQALWDGHRQWYGKPSHGQLSRQDALNIQPCVSQTDLIDYLADDIIQRIAGPWRHADWLDIWTFDTWGTVCQCEACRQLGNASDQTLYLLSQLRHRIDQAVHAGGLDHNVRLVTTAYEGTCTLDGPQNPVPENLIAAGDHINFAPILRCYAHDFCNTQCDWNHRNLSGVRSWMASCPRLPLMVDEYFNVSKFEDLPLLFTQRMAADIPAYHAMGARGLTYMHVPMTTWAMRTLTQALYAQLAWNVETDVDAFLAEYFENWYGPFGDIMQQVYQHIEDAWQLIAQWRAWGKRSVLTQLIEWDGRTPQHPLDIKDHFADTIDLIASGRKSIRLLEEAMQRILRAQADEAEVHIPSDKEPGIVNPVQARLREIHNRYEKRLGEDRRLLTYGCDTMSLMTEMAAYHDALYRGDQPGADLAWQHIEHIADQMDRYWIPINFDSVGPGYEVRDALTRSQLRPVIRNCRYHRKLAQRVPNILAPAPLPRLRLRYNVSSG